MIALCDLPDDWNPTKQPRARLIEQGYALFEICREGRSQYETWALQQESGPVYHLVQYRWSDAEGWVAALESPLLTSPREDLLIRLPWFTQMMAKHAQEKEA